MVCVSGGMTSGSFSALMGVHKDRSLHSAKTQALIISEPRGLSGTAANTTELAFHENFLFFF